LASHSRNGIGVTRTRVTLFIAGDSPRERIRRIQIQPLFRLQKRVVNVLGNDGTVLKLRWKKWPN
ncbi:MAG: hypothetical protein ABSG07_21890, partial [Terriglobales bacterium]